MIRGKGLPLVQDVRTGIIVRSCRFQLSLASEELVEFEAENFESSSLLSDANEVKALTEELED
jgi:hypothetical protein